MNGSLNDPLKGFWHLSPVELLQRLEVNADEGISDEEAETRLRHYGHNTLKVRKRTGTMRLLFSQFNTPFIYLLLFAALLSLFLYDNTDAFIIFGILLVSAFLSFIQEKNALSAMSKLLKMVQVKADVVRSKTPKQIAIEEIVPGDIVELHAGDVIPGDCYLLEGKNLFVDEAMLTGETFYVEKSTGIIAEEVPIAKRTNALFMGTHVVSGTAKAVVVSTGKNTEFGKIASHLAYKPAETDFEHGVRRLGYFLMQVTFFLLIIIFALNIYLARPVVESLLFSLSLAVGLTPQLLPAIISINLAHGAKRMSQKRVIVKRLASIENFGNMNILCADKTGTLTTGEIILDNAFDVEGKKSDQVFQQAFLNASFQSGYANPIDVAIKNYGNIDIAAWQKLDEIPYDFVRKRISVLLKDQGPSLMITKGAFQQVLDICTQVATPSGAIVDKGSCLDALQKRFVEFSEQGFRVLGLAYRSGDGLRTLEFHDEKEMVFHGFLLFWDPPKKDILTTVTNLKNLGVSLKIITGDNRLIAQKVAKLLNLPENSILTGSDLRKMSDEALLFQVQEKEIFAEIEPNQKERIILALRTTGNVVGFLGDGINDVTGLHAADVSISVDSATDAAKEVADIVLLEKDLSVLEEGVRAGRMTFANTLKYIFMATSANFGNMFSMAGASLFLSFLPLLPKQVLLTNLMEDFPEMTIATDNVDAAMIEKPLRWNLPFIRKFMLVFGLISSIFDYATFGVLLLLKANVEEFRTGWFLESVISAALIVLVIRTFKPFLTSKPSKYLLSMVLLVVIATSLLPLTPLAPFLGFTSLSWKYYVPVAIIVVLYVAMVEFAKKKFFKFVSLEKKTA